MDLKLQKAREDGCYDANCMMVVEFDHWWWRRIHGDVPFELVEASAIRKRRSLKWKRRNMRVSVGIKMV